MLPVAGTISTTQIANELNTTTINLLNAYTRAMFGVPTGAVSMSQGYSKFWPATQSKYSTPGNFTFTVPPGITQITIYYQTLAGLSSNVISVTPGQTITGSIGSAGSAGSFGGISIPAYNTNIVSWSGGIDDRFGIEFGITSQSYLVYLATLGGGSGSYGYTTTVAAPADGVLEAYFSAASGRNWGNSAIDQQPSAANAWKARCFIYDSSRGAAGYSFTLAVRKTVSLSIYYNKTPTVYNISIGANAVNFNIMSFMTTYTTWDYTPNCTINVIINSGVAVYANPGYYAFHTGTGWPTGTSLRLFNHGTIIGYGGTGGTADSVYASGYIGGGTGGNGGPGLGSGYPITIYNYGIISGGGGGGGSGGILAYYDSYYGYEGTLCAGGGGGGGASTGYGGAASGSDYGNSIAGGGGGIVTGGAGGGGVFADSTVYGGSGGAGGAYANPGASGGAASVGNSQAYTYPEKPGGSAGAAINGNSNITWSIVGTIYGAIL